MKTAKILPLLLLLLLILNSVFSQEKYEITGIEISGSRLFISVKTIGKPPTTLAGLDAVKQGLYKVIIHQAKTLGIDTISQKSSLEDFWQKINSNCAETETLQDGSYKAVFYCDVSEWERQFPNWEINALKNTVFKIDSSSDQSEERWKYFLKDVSVLKEKPLLDKLRAGYKKFNSKEKKKEIIKLYFNCVFDIFVSGLSEKFPSAEKLINIAVRDFPSSNTIIGYSGEELADMLMVKLSAEKKFNVIERAKVNKIIEEQNFSLSDLADERSSVRLGNLLGVAIVIFGRAENNITIKAVNTETGAIIYIETFDLNF